MRQDHSWDASAREYVKVYERADGAVELLAGRPEQLNWEGENDGIGQSEDV